MTNHDFMLREHDKRGFLETYILFKEKKLFISNICVLTCYQFFLSTRLATRLANADVGMRRTHVHHRSSSVFDDKDNSLDANTASTVSSVGDVGRRDGERRDRMVEEQSD